ncbi:hypothetical protein [Treponema putidum]|uniref:Uncharacterized protein n=1 Tax=Treponema putidum TaxID=221027 RepID=A0ABY5HSB9_9SPIR|nr:hypothetical protein [Treponema putidum]TWI78029.1 hypothetical protein JM98_00819 [Treponema putidum]UTY27910.1 hypothetical protein E4N76_02125 [Treponema putidum]UTY30358.1 hypothetical protein E4N75_01450 [Treponema putidum]
MCENRKKEDNNICPNLCCCIIFTVSNIVLIIAFVTLYIFRKNDWEVEVFIICSIITVVMSVLNILFCILNFLYYKEKNKNHLLTEAYDKALKKLEDDRDKHMVDTPKKDIDKKTKKEKYQETNESSQAQNLKPAEKTITINRYYKKTVAKIFETYCKNITAK